MPTVLLVLIIILLAAMLARLIIAGRNLRKNPDGGIHSRRIGDGLRKLHTDMAKYANMTGDLLAETPDDELLEAVLTGLWAKMRPDLSDAAAVMAMESRERRNLYAIYAVTGGVRQDGFSALQSSPDAAFLPTAREALQVLDLPQSAALLREGLQAEEPDAYNEPYLETFEGEGAKAKLIAYIRSNAAAFTDTP